jgi:hypothetical protein
MDCPGSMGQARPNIRRAVALLAPAQLIPDRAAGVVQQVKRLGFLRSKTAAIEYRYQAFREHRRGRNELAVGRCVQVIGISRQRYRVGTFSSA